MIKNIKEKAKALRAMDFLTRCINDEEIFMVWLSLGIADGDCESLTDEELVEDYEGSMQEIVGLFLRLMKSAGKDGLCIGNIVGTEED